MKLANDVTSRLRERVAIEKPVLMADGAGGFYTQWELFATAWAELEAVSSSAEALQGEQLEANGNYRLTLRYLDGVTPQMRVRLGKRVFDIRSVREVREVL